MEDRIAPTPALLPLDLSCGSHSFLWCFAPGVSPALDSIAEEDGSCLLCGVLCCRAEARSCLFELPLAWRHVVLYDNLVRQELHKPLCTCTAQDGLPVGSVGFYSQLLSCGALRAGHAWLPCPAASAVESGT